MSRIRPRSLSPAFCVVALVLALALSGCLAKESDEDGGRGNGQDGSSAVVVQPGGPGEAASTLEPGATAEHADAAHDDVAFMQMMIPHHAQALTMSELAPQRARSPQVKALARRILAAQRPEILTMAAWLSERELAVPSAQDDPADFDHGEHGHAAMHGMLTDEQMDELEAAHGAEFDRLFLTGMIQHHEGAIAMADAVATAGTDVQATEIANEIVIGQGAEVDRMRDLLAGL
ncbi:DUF305 domain-containing protein [Nocardioides albidus]|uniref:DUF305 domain-containing protein n=1 Tax=Nocardioides albidus TaxID=1517589 RepID=A0A5C4VSV5_9ACTN|nr:DUF305 domain-containing protein [Nocardioides albidus]TNM38389.1 DUF305 domain-containing protein [Nocardioides albidus]